GIKLAYRYQTSEFGSGRYDALLIQTLQKRDAIAEILYGGISEKRRRERDLDFDAYRTDFWPISVYSRFSGTDNTRITGYDGDAGISYRCEDSGRDDTIDLRRDHVAKLTWKVDWPMRWLAEDVAFEPGGADHAAPGGSFEMASAISRTVYDREPPVFMGYQFVGIRAEGTKMSGSTGLSVSPAQLLGIYEPALLKWLYLRRVPMAAFSLAFDTEVYRQYDEWDREVKAWRAGDLAEDRVDAVEQALDGLPAPPESLLPFRQVVALGQIVQWSPEALQTLAEGLGSGGDPDALAARADRARTWLERYNPDEILRLLDQPNSEFASELPEERRAHIRELHDALAAPGELDVPALEELVYGIPKQPDLEKKELGRRQRRFFQDVYELLLGREVGPRLGTFLWALDRERVLRLLDV
ncbi:MAG: lysyl-tRNA synthetase, class, partial [Thermoleophilaceae bacterium]|nr:lysyl-tRNA synthetase, class [Thermoleophilaceae bacterium]